MSGAVKIVRSSAGADSQGLSRETRSTGPVGVTIGNFDGLHVGHREVIDRLVAMVRAKEQLDQQPGTTVIVSFYPHPSVVLGRAQAIPQITPLHQKVSILKEWGVEKFLLLHFTPALARLSAAEFLDRYIIRGLGAQCAVLGPDTALGRNREGSKEFIAEYLTRAGLAVSEVSFKEELGERVSSRRIRALLEAGEVHAAQQLLGRPYALEGRVCAGAARGRAIGVPTANIRSPRQVIPRHGVYASWVRLPDGQKYPAVTNVGVRPTVSADGVVTIESHLLDYSGDLYGKRIEVGLVNKLRDERKFADVSELTAQIVKDIEKAREVFAC